MSDWVGYEENLTKARKTGMTRRTAIFGAFLIIAIPLLVLFGKRIYEKEVSRLRTAEGYQTFMKFYSPRPKAASFVLKNLDGKSESLKNFAGKVVFLNFRTTW